MLADDITHAVLVGMGQHIVASTVWVAMLALVVMIVPLTLTELRDARRTRRVDKLTSQQFLKGLGDLSALRRR